MPAISLARGPKWTLRDNGRTPPDRYGECNSVALVLGFRLRLLVLVLLVLVPAFILLATTARALFLHEAEDARGAAAQLASLVAERQEKDLARAEGILRAAAHIPALAALEPPACSAALADVLADTPEFHNLGAASAEGWMVCNARRQRSRIRVNDRAYFQRAVEGRRYSVGDFLVTRSTGMPSIDVALPVGGPEGLRAVLVAGIDLSRMARALEAVDAPEGSSLIVTDDEGSVLAAWPSSAGTIGVKVSAHLAPLLQSSEIRTLDVGDGVARVWAARPARTPSGAIALTVLAGIPEAAALGPARDIFAKSFVLFLLGAVAVLILAAVLAEFGLVRRLGVLAAAARRLAAGDAGARARLGRGHDEIAALGATFDEMAASLEALGRQNRLILESAGSGIFGLDRDGRVSFMNPAAARMLRLDAGTMLGMPLAEFGLRRTHAGETASSGECPVTSVLRDGVVHRETGVALTRADGSRFEAEYVATPIRDAGEIVGAVVALEDISQRLRLETELRQAQRMETVGRLAGGVAHDFNNLLTAILTFTKLARDAIPAEGPPAEDLAQVQAAAERGAALTRQLLAFARRQVLEPRDVDLGEAVRGVERMLRRIIGEDVVVTTELPPDRAAVHIDPGQLEQVLLNLVVNARDAMPRGGTLRLSVRTMGAGDPEVARAGLAGPLVALVVSDTGVGMDEATAARAFEPFFTTKPQGQGTGLGLAMVHGIVTQSGGKVRLETAPGAGATFTVFLPLVVGTAAGPAILAVPAPRGGEETILVVEDDAPVREIVRRALEGAGYHVHAVSRPGEASELVRKLAPQLLLTDVVMPGASGPELATRLEPEHPGLRVLFMSGYPDCHLDAAKGSAAFIGKPFSPEALLRKVREVLDAPTSRGEAAA